MPRILIAEDDDATRDVFRATLTHAGYEVIEAVDGEEALTRAREEKPDLILLDFSMPRMTGLDCLKVLKSEDETRRIPVIAVTAHSEMQYRIDASLAGCDGFLAKPVEPFEIVKVVETFAGPASKSAS